MRYSFAIKTKKEKRNEREFLSRKMRENLANVVPIYGKRKLTKREESIEAAIRG